MKQFRIHPLILTVFIVTLASIGWSAGISRRAIDVDGTTGQIMYYELPPIGIQTPHAYLEVTQTRTHTVTGSMTEVRTNAVGKTYIHVTTGTGVATQPMTTLNPSDLCSENPPAGGCPIVGSDYKLSTSIIPSLTGTYVDTNYLSNVLSGYETVGAASAAVSVHNIATAVHTGILVPWSAVEGTANSTASNTLVNAADSRLSDPRSPTGNITAAGAAKLYSGTYTNSATSVALSATPRIEVSGVTESMMTITDNTTNDATVNHHGFEPKCPNDITQVRRGDCSWGSLQVSASVAWPTTGIYYDAIAFTLMGLSAPARKPMEDFFQSGYTDAGSTAIQGTSVTSNASVAWTAPGYVVLSTTASANAVGYIRWRYNTGASLLAAKPLSAKWYAMAVFGFASSTTATSYCRLMVGDSTNASYQITIGYVGTYSTTYYIGTATTSSSNLLTTATAIDTNPHLFEVYHAGTNGEDIYYRIDGVAVGHQALPSPTSWATTYLQMGLGNGTVGGAKTCNLYGWKWVSGENSTSTPTTPFM